MGVYDPEILELLGDPVSSLAGVPSNSAPPGFRAPGGAQPARMIAGDAYEGASQFSRELASYRPALRSADLDIWPDKLMGDLRSRDLNRNDGLLQNGANVRKDNIVGSYYMLNAKPNSKMLFGKSDEVWETEFQEEVEENFAAAAESLDCWFDAGRRNTFTGLVRLAVDQHTHYGEVLASVEWLRDKPRPFSTAIQMIDTDRLSSPPQMVLNPFVHMGVSFNQNYAPQGYYFREAHPSDWLRPEAYTWKYVPIRKPWGRMQMLHVFDQHRPDQSRGIGSMVAAIPEMKMAKEFRQIVLQNALLNATYAATIESDLPIEAVFQRFGGSDCQPDEFANAIFGYWTGHYNAMSSLSGSAKNLNIGGVKIPHLPPGTKLHLNGAGDGGPLGTDFEAALNRVTAAALGISYEQLTKDYSHTNYSSARAAGVETMKAMLAVKKSIADRFATLIYQLWFEESMNNGLFTSLKRRMPSFYDGLNKEFYTACDWVGASRGQIDELKETQAAVLRLDNGLGTLEDETARLGKDWRKQLRQMKREQQMKKDLGLDLQPTDTTGQMNALSATPQDKAPSDNKKAAARLATLESEVAEIRQQLEEART